MTAKRMRRVVALLMYGVFSSSLSVQAEPAAGVHLDREPSPIYEGSGHVGTLLSPSADGVIHLAGGPFAAQHVTLKSWLSLTDLGAFGGNDCWGYVSPSGREYALMGISNALKVVEITDPVNPMIVATISHTDSLWGDIKVYQDHCYVVNESGGGIDVIDLSNVDGGVVTLVQRVTAGGMQTSHDIAIDTVSGYLYLCGGNINGGRVVAWDLSNPDNPVIAGQMTSASGGSYLHDAQAYTFSSGPNAGKQIIFGGSESRGLDIYDVTNKANMFRISRTTYPGLSYAHQVWISDDEQYLYLDDELDGINRTSVFDISSLSAPVYLGDYSSNVASTDHNLYYRDGFIYEAEYTSGLRIFCADDPVNPVQVGWFDTYPEDDAASFNGAWSVYPFFPSGNVVISDENRGLFVVDPSAALTAGTLTIDYPSGQPDLVSPDGGTQMPVNVTAVCGATIAPGSATLHYDLGAGLVSVPMSLVSGDTYEAVFPIIPCGATVTYYVSGMTVGGVLVTDPPDAPTSWYSALSASSLNIQLEDAMEVDSGWVVGAPSDTATTGIWVRDDPIGTGAQPEDDHTPDPGTICFVTGQGTPGGSLGENDIDGGATSLFSPILNLTDPETRIGYWRWYSNAANGVVDDSFVIDISNDDGATWTNVETLGPGDPGTTGGWVYHEFMVADFVTPTIATQLRFVAADVAPGSIVEAAIDDLRVFTPVCDAPPPGIPTISQWGAVVLSVFLLTGGTVVFHRRRTVRTVR